MNNVCSISWLFYAESFTHKQNMLLTLKIWKICKLICPLGVHVNGYEKRRSRGTRSIQIPGV